MMNLGLMDPAFLGSLGGERDPYFSSVSLLLHGTGTNGSTSIIDSSPLPKTVTAFGNAQISTAQSKFGGASIAFDGTGDYLRVASTGTPGDLGSGNFTVECWSYLISRTSQYPSLVSNYSTFNVNSFGLFADYNESGKYQIALGGFPTVTSSADVVYNQWVYVAVVRSAGTVTLYVNGTSSGSSANTANLTGNTGALWIGSPGDIDSPINGYIDDLRITKGIARYTANFTPPTAPFPDA
jgi:hypothetical protein